MDCERLEILSIGRYVQGQGASPAMDLPINTSLYIVFL